MTDFVSLLCLSMFISMSDPDLCNQRQFPMQAVNFFSFDMYRKTFTRMGGGTLSNEARLTAGALAGAPVFPLVHIPCQVQYMAQGMK